MRAALLLGLLVLAGCLGAPAAPPPPAEDAGDITTPVEAAPPPGAGTTPPRATPGAGDALVPAAGPSADAPDPGPLVVIAHVDTGINPYAAAFRDASPLAFVHPSRYLPGYPANATALPLTLTAGSVADAVALDRAVWDA
ncbi:MAG: hypothetical protein LC624_12615, partial [Halobacteriales archaeon]|nr:hypothetical protein [Halobacteriales archaeon]